MLHLGCVTYNVLKDWDLETIIRNLEQAGFEAVELRTGHTHGAEPSLSSDQRKQIMERFQRTGTGSGVGLAGIRERIKEIGGDFTIDSNSKGTVLRAVVPLSPNKSVPLPAANSAVPSTNVQEGRARQAAGESGD